MKLSAKQKEVIQKMREGATIRNYYGGRTDSFSFAGKSLNVKTFEVLRDLKLIQRQIKAVRMMGSTHYELTELGKSITL